MQATLTDPGTAASLPEPHPLTPSAPIQSCTQGPAVVLASDPLAPAIVPGAGDGAPDAARQVTLSSFEVLPTAVHEGILDLMPMQSRLRLEHQVSKPLQSRLQHRARHDAALRQAATVWTVDEFHAVVSGDPGHSFGTLAPHSRAAVLVALAHRLRGLPSSSHGSCFQALLVQALRLPPPLRAMPLDALAECLGDSALKVSGDTQVACAERIAAEPLPQSARLRRALLRRALLLQGRSDLAGIAAHLLPDARAALELLRAYPAPCHVDTHSIVAGALARTGADQDAAAVWRDLLEGAAQETFDAGPQGRLIAVLVRLLPPVPDSHPSGERDDDASGQCLALLLDTVFSLPGERLYRALAWLLGATRPASTELFLYAARAKQQRQLLDGIAQRMESAALTEPQRLHLRAAFLRYLPDQAAWDTLWQAAMDGENSETLALLGALLPLCQTKAPDTTRLQAVASAGLHVSTLAPSDRSALLKDVLYQRRNHIDDAGLAEATFASVARLARDHGDYGLLAQWPQRHRQTERDRVVGVILDLPAAEQVKAVRIWLREGSWGELGNLACFSALAEPLAQAGHLIQLAELAGAICNRCAEWISVTDTRAWPNRWAEAEGDARHLADDWIGLLERMPPCQTPGALAAAAQFAHQLDAVTDQDGALVRRAWQMIARLDADDLRACLAQLLPLRPREAWTRPARGLQDKLPRSAVVSAAPLVRARLSSAERREWLAYCLGRLWVQESERERLPMRTGDRRFDGARQAMWALAMTLPPAQWAYAAACLAEWFDTPPDGAEERAAWEQAKAQFHALFGG